MKATWKGANGFVSGIGEVQEGKEVQVTEQQFEILLSQELIKKPTKKAKKNG